MGNKIVIFLMLICMVVSLWWFRQRNESVKHDRQQSEQVVNVGEKDKSEDLIDLKSNATAGSSTTDAKATNSKPDEELERALKAMEQRRYSNDPFVEFISVTSEFSLCHQTVMNYRLKEVIVTDKRADILTKHDQKCDALVKRYPFLADMTALQSVGKKVRALPSQTALGDFYREDNAINAMPSNFSAYFSQMSTHAIQSKNSQLLVQHIEVVSQPFLKPDTVVTEVVGGLDENYHRLIQVNALGLLSCDYQGGISCESDAQIMLNKCMENELYCGLNFIQWYQLHTTEALKKDVEKLIQYYRSI